MERAFTDLDEPSRRQWEVGGERSADAPLQKPFVYSGFKGSLQKLRQPDRSDDAGYPALASLYSWHPHRTCSRSHDRQAFSSPTQDESGLHGIADVLVHETYKMPFVQNDQIVEKIQTTVPTQRSATPFCHGLRKLVRFGWMPKLLTTSIISALKLEPRSKIR
jgi:hypothetical protein